MRLHLGYYVVLRAVSTLFIVLGVALLGLTSAYYVYAWYMERSFDLASYSSGPGTYSPPAPSAGKLFIPGADVSPFQFTPYVTTSETGGMSQAGSDLASQALPPITAGELSGSAIAEEPSSIPMPKSLEAKTAQPAERPLADWIYIPKIKVDSKIVELGTKIEKGQVVWETPNKVVGHAKGTGTPGGSGNIVMYGHISSPLRGEGSIFKQLPELKVGDGVYLYVGETEFHYQVIETKVVIPSDVSVMDATPDETLTLITCVPDWVYSHRLI